MTPTEIAIRFVRACGPVSPSEIEAELLKQCQSVKTEEDARVQTAKILQNGLSTGWLGRYDEESYFVPSGL